MLDVTYHGLLESPPEEATRAWLDLLVGAEPRARLRRTSPRGDAPASSASSSCSTTKNSGAIVGAVGHARENARSVRELDLDRAVGGREHVLARAAGSQPSGRHRGPAVRAVRPREAPLPDGDRRGGRDDVARRRLAVLDARVDARAGRDVVPAAERPLRRAVRRDRPRGVPPARRSAEVGVGVGGVSQDATAPRWIRRDVVEFLLLSRTFPRSVLYCLRQAERDLARLTAGDALTRPERIVGRIRAELEFCDVGELARGRPPCASRPLQDGVRQVADAIAVQYFRNVHDRPPLDPRSPFRRARLTGAPRHQLPHEVRLRRPRARVAERAAGRADERSPAAADLVSGDDDSRVTRLLVHRLLGHAGRRVRCPRAARVARGRRRGVGRDAPRAAAHCVASHRRASAAKNSETSTSSTSCRLPHADWGPGVADAARRVLDSDGPDLVSVVLAIHRKVGESIRYQPGSTYVGVEVEDVLGRGMGVCQDFAHLAVAMCRSVGHPGPLRVRLPVHDRRRDG